MSTALQQCQEWTGVLAAVCGVSCGTVFAPLQEISSSEAQIRLMKRIASRNMARNLADRTGRSNRRIRLAEIPANQRLRQVFPMCYGPFLWSCSVSTAAWNILIIHKLDPV